MRGGSEESDGERGVLRELQAAATDAVAWRGVFVIREDEGKMRDGTTCAYYTEMAI